MTTVAACGLLLLAPAGRSATTLNGSRAKAAESSEIQILKQQMQELEQKVCSLEQRQEQDRTNAMFTAESAPKISLGAGGLSIVSADTNFAMNLRGYVQLDSRSFFQNAAPGVDGFLLRRVHPIISGTVLHDFSYQFMAEFGGSSPSIYDAYVNYHPRPDLQLEAGRFKTPLGLEWLQPATLLPFNERSLATDLVPLRDLGVELHGDLFEGRVNYAAGIFNSVADGANAANSNFDNDQEFIGRIFLHPFIKAAVTALRGFGFGAGGSYGSQSSASALTSGYKTDGQQKFFSYAGGAAGNGAHWRFSPQACYYWGPFNLSGEYVVSDQEVKLAATPGTTADLQNNAWDVSAGWVLTGENASDKGVTPGHPFTLQHGGWGAWQIVARCEGLEVDNHAFPTFASSATSASAARAWSLGLNWWLNRNVRIMCSFSRTTFTGGATGPVTKKPEEVLFTRIQLAF